MFTPTAPRTTRSYAALVRAWRRIVAGTNARVRASVGPSSLLVIDIGERSAPTILVSAGTHGDEPAAVAALASLVRDRSLDRRFAYRILPCINPAGFRAGTRANARGADINRSFTAGGTTPEARACIAATERERYILSIDLHEDLEADGFYVYDSVHGSRTSLSEKIVRAIDTAGLPVQELTHAFDLGYAPSFDGSVKLRRGRVTSSFEQEVAAFTGWPFTTYVLAEHTRNALIVESARRAPFDARVRMHRLAVRTAIAQLEARPARALWSSRGSARSVR